MDVKMVVGMGGVYYVFILYLDVMYKWGECCGLEGGGQLNF